VLSARASAAAGQARRGRNALDPSVAHFLAQRERYGRPLAGRSASSAMHDRAKYLASLYVDDLADVIARRHRSALRAVALRRAARGQRADLRRLAAALAASRRWSTRLARRSDPASCSPRISPTWSA
jgi:hypothetical protein